MIIQCLTHVPFEGPGCIAQWAQKNNVEIRNTRLFSGEPVPSVDSFDLLLIMGGPMSVLDEMLYPWLKLEKKLVRDAINADKKVMGICLGAQMIANALGAEINKNPHTEIGWYPVHFTEEALKNKLVRDFPKTATVFHWHGETFDIPTGAVLLGSSEACKNQGFLIGDSVIGMQFHLEETEESLSEISEACRTELVQGPFIQEEPFFRSQKKWVASANGLLFSIMDKMK